MTRVPGWVFVGTLLTALGSLAVLAYLNPRSDAVWYGWVVTVVVVWFVAQTLLMLGYYRGGEADRRTERPILPRYTQRCHHIYPYPGCRGGCSVA